MRCPGRGRVLAFTWILWGFAAEAVSQYEGGVRGVVRDVSGGVIPGAPVTLTNESTNVARTASTNEIGEYSFANVLPGTYTLESELDGYRRFRRTGIEIDVQRFFVLDITLELGPVTEQIDVTAESPVLDTGSASIGTSLRSEELESLPSFGRNPFTLSTMMPTVQWTGSPVFQASSDQNNSSAISISGGPVRANNYTLDGVPITDLRNRAVIIPSIESVEEVRIQVSTYDAEMGRTGGGVFNTLHKRGGNQIHGSALIQNRPKWGQARDFFTKRAGEELPEEVSHWLYGGSVGGPIVRDRTFFWASTEGFRNRRSESGVSTFPTEAEARGDFSQSGFTIYDPLTTRPDPGSPSGFVREPFPGNIIPPERLNPVGVRLVELMTASGTGEQDITQTNEISADQFSLNITHSFDDRHSLGGTYLFFDSREAIPSPLETGVGDAFAVERRNHIVALNHTFLASDTTVYQFRYGYTSFQNDLVSDRFDITNLGFSDNFLSQTTDLFPEINAFPYPGLGPPPPERERWYTHAVNGSITTLVGNHSLKAGGSFRRLGVEGVDEPGSGSFNFTNDFTRGPDPLRPDRRTGDALASLLLGFPASGRINVSTPTNFFVSYFAGFIQDDWRLSEKLVLNLGLRIEHETGLMEENNAFTVGFDRDSPWPVQPIEGMVLRGGLLYAGVDGNPTHQGDPTPVKLGPRAGASYSLDEKTVLKGGYGVFWSPTQYPGVNEATYGTRGFTATTEYLASENFVPVGTLTDPFPRGLESPEGSSLGLLTGAGTTVSFVDQFSRSPYVQQFTFGVEREIARDMAVSATYIGSRGSRLDVGGSGQAPVDINQVDPSFLALETQLVEPVPNPFFGNPLFGNLSERETVERAQLLRPYPQFLGLLARQVSEGRSRYDALALRIQKRFRDGYSVNANYTWSRLHDNVFGQGGFFNSTTFEQALDSTDLDREYGPSNFDVPHRLNVTGIFELPFGNGKRWLDSDGALDALFGGWSITVAGVIHSGLPVKVVSVPNTGLFNSVQRPNRVPGVDPILGNDPDESLQYLNPEAWEPAEPFTFGDTPRTDDDVRNRGRNNWDIAFQKSADVGTVRTTVRFEWINIFNRPEFRTPFPGVGFPNFGELFISAGSIPRTLQITMRVEW